MRKINVNFSVKLFLCTQTIHVSLIPILQNEFYCEYFEK